MKLLLSLDAQKINESAYQYLSCEYYNCQLDIGAAHLLKSCKSLYKITSQTKTLCIFKRLDFLKRPLQVATV